MTLRKLRVVASPRLAPLAEFGPPALPREGAKRHQSSSSFARYLTTPAVLERSSLGTRRRHPPPATVALTRRWPGSPCDAAERRASCGRGGHTAKCPTWLPRETDSRTTCSIPAIPPPEGRELHLQPL